MLVVFEPNRIRPGSREEQAAALSDVVKYSRASVHGPSREWVPPRGSRTRLIVETLGSSGLRYRMRLGNGAWSRWNHMPSIVSVRVTDTAGAGDWCTAGMINELATTPGVQRWTRDRIEEALTFGQALAAASVSFDGPRVVLAHADAATIKRIARRAGAVGAVSTRSIRRLGTRVTPTRVASERGTCALCLSPTARGHDKAAE